MEKIIDYNRNELIDLIENDKEKFQEQYNYLKDLNNLLENYCTLYNKQLNKKKGTIAIWILTLLLILFIILCLVAIFKIFSILPLDIHYSFLAVFALVSVLLVSIIPISHFTSIHSINKKLDKHEEKISQKIQLIEDLRLKTKALSVIPFMYQTPAAMREIKEYLINYRADNWTDAVNLLEETIHRKQLLYLQGKQLSSLNQQLTLLSDIKKNAGTSGLDVVTAIVGLFT